MEIDLKDVCKDVISEIDELIFIKVNDIDTLQQKIYNFKKQLNILKIKKRVYKYFLEKEGEKNNGTN